MVPTPPGPRWGRHWRSRKEEEWGRGRAVFADGYILSENGLFF